MQRRRFLHFLSGTMATWPLAARAQQSEPVRLIGVLMAIAENDSEGKARITAFRDELRALGWIEGENIRIEARWAIPRDGAKRERLASEIVALRPDIILSHATPSTSALVDLTSTIPIVFVGVSDPVGSRFVGTFARPGANVTGFITMEPTMAGKWLELLKEILPSVNRVVFLYNPVTAPYIKYYLVPFQAAGKSFKIDVIETPVRTMSNVESVIAAHAREPNSGLIVMPDTFMNAHRKEVTALAAHHRIPAVFAFRFFAELGGLASYGIDLVDQYRQAAKYVDRILHGAQPSEFPVQSPVKFELVINLGTARAMGIEIPTALLARADEVIN